MSNESNDTTKQQADGAELSDQSLEEVAGGTAVSLPGTPMLTSIKPPTKYPIGITNPVCPIDPIVCPVPIDLDKL